MRFLVTGVSSGIGLEAARARSPRCERHWHGQGPRMKTVQQGTATPAWAAVVADPSALGGHYLEDCAVAPVNDSPNPFADGVRSYAIDPDRTGELWARNEAWISMRAVADAGYMAMAPDLRGYGETEGDWDPRKWTAMDVMGDLVAILDHVGVDQVT
ncbi:hypothetical protein LTR94_007363 [Friedmanniomyces endolithicus]|nr:hypothetical protein LTR94_007363 [Friedmanniomyces endolithicus]